MPRRRKTRSVRVGSLVIGGEAPIAVQTMTKVSVEDVEATLAQIEAAAAVGCDLIRCAVPNVRAAEALAAVVKRSPLPVVADIHFDGRIALAAIKAGAAKIRINPGNMTDWEMLARVAVAARDADVAIR
ncbi:MAG: flavodoxin-dependent (E)-4-hydroxy-3-methylbut-2-enyl-diphosphate synthase, partial [Planctomycetota bacterium]|nr:flavodoxin-dependent (E)-4-hydroxy-3-methylbut-2-enyl-diphosphate synthase [Planctomycetota bacterium]